MAYMNQEKKNIAAALKTVMPKDWKYSLSVSNHSTIVLTIKSAPVDLLEPVNTQRKEWALREGSTRECDNKPLTNCMIHQNRREDYYEGSLLETFNKIFAALNLNNHDRSDSQTDYFDVGHYVDLSLGGWNKPFICTK